MENDSLFPERFEGSKRDFCIDIIEKFHCAGGECQNTCCMGWQVPVDEETYARYLVMPGIRGRAYRSHIEKKEPRRIKKILLRCPFLTSNRTCLHQECGDEHLMPVVCRNFPRRVTDYGYFKEACMDLSCEESAGVFLKNLGRRSFIPSKNRLVSLWDMENDDKDFLLFLLNEREKILDFIWADGPLFEKWEALFAYIYEMHEHLARNDFDAAKSVELTTDKDKQGAHAVLDGSGYAFYKIEMIDKILIYNVDYGGLMLRVPKFYHFIRRYLKIYSKKQVDTANTFFHENIQKMCENPHFETKYKSYFSYTLQQEFLQAYESYSMIRELCLCILYTQMLMLFDSIEIMDRGSMDFMREREILYLSEHNLRHNPALTKNLYSVIRDEVL